MADEFGPTTPAEPDPIDRRLRQLARDTEPLVILAGPAAARRRGERRTGRRRAAVAGMAAVLALGVGSWQLLPRLGGDRTGTAPAATVPAATPTTAAALAARLEAELMPPSALPLYPKHQWETVPNALAAAKFPESCPLGMVDLHAEATATRVYRTPDGMLAYYRLYALSSADAAADGAMLLGELIKAKCDWVDGFGANGKLTYGNVPDIGSGGPAAGSADRKRPASAVWLARRGGYVALLDVDEGALGLKSGLPGTSPWPGQCISESLARLSGYSASAGSSSPSAVDPC